MTDNMKRFLEEAEKDAAFAEKIDGADSPETMIALAAEKGITLTAEDLTPEEATCELSDDELDDVAGGGVMQSLYSRLKLRFSLWTPKAGGLLLNKDRMPATSDLVYHGTGNSAPAASNLMFFGGAGGPQRLGNTDGGTTLKEV